MHALTFGTLSLLALMSWASLPAQTWTKKNPANPPERLVGETLYYDSQSGNPRGWSPELPGNAAAFDTIWTWDGNEWSTMVVGPGPTQREVTHTAYDSDTQTMYIASGESGLGQWNDLWSYGGGMWTSAPMGPGFLKEHRMAYDQARQQVVMFGGRATATFFVNLTQLLSAGGGSFATVNPMTKPAARAAHGMAYDSQRQVVVMFGGRSNTMTFNDTWEWNGTNWTQITTADSPPEMSGPAMAYDSDRGVVVLYGGSGPSPQTFRDTWEYNGTNWVKTVQGPETGGFHRMVYDAARQEMVLLNEPLTGPPLETWVLSSQLAASYEAFGMGCAGSSGVPSLDAMGGDVPQLNASFDVEVTGVPMSSTAVFLVYGFSDTKFGSLDLPLDLGFLGLWNCTAYVSVFTTVPMTKSLDTATFSLPIPNDPSLVGLNFFNQAVVQDSGAPNPLQFILSNAARGTVGN